MAYVSAASRIAFAREDNFGTKTEAFGGTAGEGSASPRFIGITDSGFPMFDANLDVRQYRSFGSGRNWFKNIPARVRYEGNIPFLPTTGEMFYYALGNETFEADTPSAGTNRHTLTPDESATLPSMNVSGALLGSSDFLRTFLGVTVDSFSGTLQEAGEVSAEFEVKSQDVVDWDNSSPNVFTQPTDDGSGDIIPHMFHDRTANITMLGTYDSATHSITGGTDIGNVTRARWGIQNNIEGRWYSRSSNAQNPAKFTTSFPDFNFQFTMEPDSMFENDDEAVYWMVEGEERGDILLPFERPDGTKLDFVFEDAMLQAAPHSLDEDGSVIKVQVQPVFTDFRVVVEDDLGEYSTL